MRYTGYNLVSFQRCTCITLFEKSLWQSGDVLMWHCTVHCDIVQLSVTYGVCAVVHI